MNFPIRLNHSPTFCALEPPTDSQIPTLSKELADDTWDSVMDWENKLNQGTGKYPLWTMTLMQIPLSQQKDYDYTKCDIVINYLAKPNTANTGFVATGMTIPNLDTGKTRIEIYYTMLEVGYKKLEWVRGDTIYYAYVPVPVYLDGSIETHAQLEGIIRHEIGHSLGLGHYIVSSGELQNIVHGLMDMPSIMIDTTTTFGVTHYDITPFDISEIKLIYGNNGFHGGISSGNFKRTDVVAIDKANYNMGEPVDVQFNTNNFDENTRGALLAIDPDGMLLANVGVTKDNSTLQIKTDNKFGDYYVEFIDYGNELYDYAKFSISGGTSIPQWIKSNAKWWADGSIGDNDFVKGIQYLIQQKIITIPPTTQESSFQTTMPSWVKKDAGYWASGEMTDDDFIKAIQYLITNGMISP